MKHTPYSKKSVDLMFFLKGVLFVSLIILVVCCSKIFSSSESFQSTIGPFDFDSYGKYMMENQNRKLVRPRLTKDIPIETEDCESKCNQRACIQMAEQKRVLNECLKCNAQKNKCYAKSIIGGVCNDCDDSEITGKMDCLNILNFGCINPYNIDSNNGVEPYFIQMPSDTVTSPFDTDCVFCWQLKDFV